MTTPDESTASTDIPVLTDVVAQDPAATSATELPSDVETLIAELQIKLAANAFVLMEKSLRAAFSQMEATLFEQVLHRLRQDLPELVDTVLREHFGTEIDQD